MTPRVENCRARAHRPRYGHARTSLAGLVVVSVAALECMAAVFDPIATSGHDVDIVYEVGLAAGPAGANSEIGSRQFYATGIYTIGAPPTDRGLPQALPEIFTGLKVGAALSATAAVVAEFVASNRGLGYLLLTAGFFVCGFHIAFVTTHLPPYLGDLGFSASLFFFNKGEIGISAPLVYPFLLYLLARMLFAGFVPRESREALVPFAIAQSTLFMAPAVSGMNRVNAATRSAGAFPPSSSPGWKIGAPSGRRFSSARTWLFERM